MTEHSWEPFLTERDQEQPALLESRYGGLFVPDPPGASAAYLSSLLPSLLQAPTLVVLDGPRTMDAFAVDVKTFLNGMDPVSYPPWESLPGHGVEFAPVDLMGDRLDVLRQLLANESPPLMITCIHALMQRTVSPDELLKQHIRVERQQEIDFSSFLHNLEGLHYAFEAEVTTKGQAAHRGGIIDVWTPQAPWPYRLEWFGSTLESIRAFDPAEQRSIESLNEITVLPAREIVTSDTSTKKTTPFHSYLPPQTRWVWCHSDRIREHALQYEKVIEAAEASVHTLSYRSLCAGIKKRFKATPIYLGGPKPRDAAVWSLNWRATPSLSSTGRTGLDPGVLEQERNEYVNDLEARVATGETVRMYFGTPGTLERFVEWRMPKKDPRTCFQLVAGPLSEGFHYTDARLIIVSEQDLYGKHRETHGRHDTPARRRKSHAMPGTRLAEWRDIQPGELVVHVAHGIGRYLGLYEIDSNGQQQEVLAIEYADRTKLFLPVSQAHLLSRYVGFGKQRPDLHALGGKKWQR